MALCRMQREYSAQEGEDAWEWWVRGCLGHARLGEVHFEHEKRKKEVTTAFERGRLSSDSDSGSGSISYINPRSLSDASLNFTSQVCAHTNKSPSYTKPSADVILLL